MDDNDTILVDAVPSQKRRSRKKDPKPWVVLTEKPSPKFEQFNGEDAIHVGFELHHSPDNPAKLILSPQKLYLKFDNASPLMMFWIEQRAKLTCSYDIPGYAVFPIGRFLTSQDVKQSNQQTMYKRAWQMTHQEWKEGKTPLTCETSDDKLFWKKLYEFVDAYREQGKERKSKKRKIDGEDEGSVASTITRNGTPATASTATNDGTPGVETNATPLSEIQVCHLFMIQGQES
jgi:hypothetical protein